MKASALVLIHFCALAAPAIAALVDPASVVCGPSEYTFCGFKNGLTRDGAVPRKCNENCLCEGHMSFYGDNLDWINEKCVTGEGYACGVDKTDKTMEIFCEAGTNCIEGRCREPNFQKFGAGGRCRDDIECDGNLKCRMHFVKSPPLPLPNFARVKRAIGPQWCCSARSEEKDKTEYTMENLPCNKY